MPVEEGRVDERTVEEILAAIAATERVTATLRRYPERDRAIELLEDDVAVQRQMLVQDLRRRLQPHTRAALA